MKSLERQLQVNLAITLIMVMALIWVVGSQLPRSLPDEQALQTQGYTCTPATDAVVAPIVEHRQHRFKWLFPILAAGGIGLILVIQGVVIRRTFRRLDHIRTELQTKNPERQGVRGCAKPVRLSVSRTGSDGARRAGRVSCVPSCGGRG